MKRPSPLHFLAVVLCVLVLFAVQTFGAMALYFCACGDTPVPTPAAYCYGPHSDKCVDEEAHGSGSAGDEGSGDRRDHQVVKQEVQLRPLEVAPSLVAPQVLVAILPSLETFFTRQEIKVPAVHPVDYGESPPFGVTVARTVVLLI